MVFVWVLLIKSARFLRTKAVREPQDNGDHSTLPDGESAAGADNRRGLPTQDCLDSEGLSGKNLRWATGDGGLEESFVFKGGSEYSYF